MDAKASACARTCVGYRSICLKSSGSDHVHADRIANLQALTARLTISHFAQFAVLGIAEVPHRRASPAGLLLKSASSSIAQSGLPRRPNELFQHALDGLNRSVVIHLLRAFDLLSDAQANRAARPLR
jgi:hypothetical protein